MEQAKLLSSTLAQCLTVEERLKVLGALPALNLSSSTLQQFLSKCLTSQERQLVLKALANSNLSTSELQQLMSGCLTSQERQTVLMALTKRNFANNELQQFLGRCLTTQERQIVLNAMVHPTERAFPASQLNEQNSKDAPKSQMYDLFISHASEDKEVFVRPLAEALQKNGVSVWYDEFTLRLGDSLRRSIDNGLANTRYGLVVLSYNFFAKEWPQRELDGLFAREINNKKVILPIWHEITQSEIAHFSPLMADRLAIRSNKGVDAVVREVTDVIAS